MSAWFDVTTPRKFLSNCWAKAFRVWAGGAEFGVWRVFDMKKTGEIYRGYALFAGRSGSGTNFSAIGYRVSDMTGGIIPSSSAALAGNSGVSGTAYMERAGEGCKDEALRAVRVWIDKTLDIQNLRVSLVVRSHCMETGENSGGFETDFTVTVDGHKSLVFDVVQLELLKAYAKPHTGYTKMGASGELPEMGGARTLFGAAEIDGFCYPVAWSARVVKQEDL